MTNKERRELCEILRDMSVPSSFRVANPIGAIAADEIERLTEELDNVWIILRQCQNDVLVAERERNEVLCRVKGSMQ